MIITRAIKGLLIGQAMVLPMLAVAAEPAATRTTTEERSAADVKADNSQRNKVEQHKGVTNATSQSSAKNDIELAAAVRKAIVADEKLSTYAHNVKVVVRDGRVELQGPVRSDDEKRTVAALATDVAGQGKVTNNLTIAAE
jgi:osmotically-inducible protein OsmY